MDALPVSAMSAIQPTHHRRSRRAWLSLVLCLACWRGPIPWVHEHALNAAAGPELFEHLVREHGHDVDDGHAHWHMHIVLPWALFHLPCEQSPASPAPADPLSTQGTMLTSLELPALSGPPLLERYLDAADQRAGVPLRADVPVSRGETDPGGGTYSVSLLLCAPLCAVTGVALI